MESRDPRLVPLFIGYSFMVSYARTALVEFGERAVTDLIRTINDPEDPLSRRGGAIGSLGGIVRRSRLGMAPPLSDDLRAAVSVVAHELLGHRFIPGYTGSITQLALATGDVELRKDLVELAVDPAAWARRGVTDERLVTPGRRIISRLLDRTPAP